MSKYVDLKEDIDTILDESLHIKNIIGPEEEYKDFKEF